MKRCQLFRPLLARRRTYVSQACFALIGALIITLGSTSFFDSEAAAATYAPGAERTPLGDALIQRLAIYERAAGEANYDLMLSFYSRDVVLVGTADGAVIGMEAAQPIIKSMTSRPSTVRTEIVKTVSLSPTSALTLLMQYVNDRPIKSVFVWRLEGGKWLLVNDTYFSGKY